MSSELTTVTGADVATSGLAILEPVVTTSSISALSSCENTSTLNALKDTTNVRSK